MKPNTFFSFEKGETKQFENIFEPNLKKQIYLGYDWWELTLGL